MKMQLFEWTAAGVFNQDTPRRPYSSTPTAKNEASPLKKNLGTILGATTVQGHTARQVDAAVINATARSWYKGLRSSNHRRPISFLDRI